MSGKEATTARVVMDTTSDGSGKQECGQENDDNQLLRRRRQADVAMEEDKDKDNLEGIPKNTHKIK